VKKLASTACWRARLGNVTSDAAREITDLGATFDGVRPAAAVYGRSRVASGGLEARVGGAFARAVDANRDLEEIAVGELAQFGTECAYRQC
jgi:hypothetical protein